MDPGIEGLGLTIILPCFNAASCVEHSLRRIDHYLQQHPGDHVILVDDGSDDETGILVENLLPKLQHSDRFRLLTHTRNQGKGMAIKTGMGAVETELACYTDIDLAYDLSNLTSMRKQVQEYALVIADRVHTDSIYCIRPSQFGYIASRHRSSRFMNALLGYLLKLGVEDVQAGLKMARTEVFRPLVEAVRLQRFSFDLELLVLAKARKVNLVEAAVRYRSQDDSTTVRFLVDTLAYFRDLAKVCWRYYRGHYR